MPGMVASKTSLPVIGVPIMSKALSGIDSVYSILQMPKGCPVATMAIGVPGAINAALFAGSVLALSSDKIKNNSPPATPDPNSKRYPNHLYAFTCP